jgi:multidrug efflux pump subunit AcrA (membrane-fusion protein)
MNVETKFTRHADTLDDSFELEAAQKKRRNIIIAVILAVIILGVLVMRFVGGNSTPAAPTEATRQAPRVTVIVPGSNMVESVISATGSLAARRDMPVGAVGEGGMVTRVFVEAGDWVRAGQILASVDRQVQSQQSESLSAQIRVAEADARLSQNELDRAKALAERGFISKTDIDKYFYIFINLYIFIDNKEVL